VWTHLSARLSDGTTLLTPGTKLFREVEPGDLKKSSDNVTADVIHKAVYDARPDVNAIVHLHTPAAVAVSCLEDGFMCLAQDSAFFYERVAYHDWEGLSDDVSECERLGKAVKAGANTLLMRNHGFCTFGASVAEAWVLAYYFESSCQVQLAALSTRQALLRPPADILLKARKQTDLPEFRAGACEWDALVKLAEEDCDSGGAALGVVGRNLPGAATRAFEAAHEEAAPAGEEAALRAELAVAHRLTRDFGMDQLVWNHISARLADGGVLITPGRRMYSQIGPEDLLKNSNNVTADIIHSAVYSGRRDVHAIVHLHTPSAVAVSCLESGFECMAQHAAVFASRVGYHDWEGVSDDQAEGERLAAAVRGGVNVLVMRNHGFCTLGKSVAEAWVLAYYFEKSCETQLKVLQAGQTIRAPSSDVMAHAAKQTYLPGFCPGDSEWTALTRLAKRPRTLGGVAAASP